jgi:hypothetical protein
MSALACIARALFWLGIICIVLAVGAVTLWRVKP